MGRLLAVGLLMLAGSCRGNRMSVNNHGSGTASAATGTLTDPRDGRTYKTVRISGRWLMAENLAYKPESGGFWAYGDNPDHVKTYGYLYDWDTAKRVAPPGWHLPTYDEWLAFRAALGGKRDAYKYLGGTMETVYKRAIVGGDSGFDARLGGARESNGKFRALGEFAYFWSATMGPEGAPWRYMFDSKPGGVARALLDSKEGSAYLAKSGGQAPSGMSVRLFRD